jgi:class 3 adenylate cyclase/YHS domain-containing protein
MVGRSVERTFYFVDLAGFTALTEAHGDADAVVLIDRFVSIGLESLSAGDEMVKSIGDAVMLASPTPQAAVRVLEHLWERCAEARGFPLPSAGAHHGSAIDRGGDYLGAAVNLAARVADHAGGGEVLATAEVAAAARDRGHEVLGLGAHRFRNLAEPVELYQINLGSGDRLDVIDPVCRMRVDPERAEGSIVHAGRRFWFCSLPCVGVFAANPDRYAAVDD